MKTEIQEVLAFELTVFLCININSKEIKMCIPRHSFLFHFLFIQNYLLNIYYVLGIKSNKMDPILKNGRVPRNYALSFYG